MDQKEFKILAFPMKDKLFRFAKSMLGNQEEAEDAVQETFIKLWLKRKSLSKKRNLEAFSMVVTRNLCIDRIRARKKNNIELKDTIIADNSPTPQKTIELNENVDFVKKIISGLADQQKMIVHLRDIEGYTYEEIEKITGLNRNVIKVNLSRARKKIREELYKVYKYEHDRN